MTVAGLKELLKQSRAKPWILDTTVLNHIEELIERYELVLKAAMESQKRIHYEFCSCDGEDEECVKKDLKELMGDIDPDGPLGEMKCQP